MKYYALVIDYSTAPDTIDIKMNICDEPSREEAFLIQDEEHGNSDTQVVVITPKEAKILQKLLNKNLPARPRDNRTHAK